MCLSVLVVIKLFSDPSLPGAITLSDLKVNELAQQAFQVSGPAVLISTSLQDHTSDSSSQLVRTPGPIRVIIDAVGSTDDRGEARGFAAYPWIIKENTGEVVWSMMNASNITQDGSLVRIEKDELVLDVGKYILNFATYGGMIQSSIRSSYRNDRRKWHVVLRSPDDKNALRPLSGTLDVNSDDLVWEATSLEGDEKREYLFGVHSPIELSIRAIGQLSHEDEVLPVDYSRIEDAVTGGVIWQLTRDNTTWAGGIRENRIYQGQSTIPPGIYRAIAATNSRHHYNSWTGNPPFNPQGWGLHLSTSNHKEIYTFDPWMRRDPIIQFIRVRNDEEYSQIFSVLDTTAVVFYALGEITGPYNGYDLAKLEKHQSDGESTTLWEMSWGGSVHAGGARKNRKEVEFLRLEPGSYTLYYESDGSHSYEAWNSGEPDYPERWGVAMFPVESQNSTIIVGVQSESSDASSQ
ncbi:MAG: hypothetical protein OXE92_07665 [Bacteroidetes bacterium]|nr:hypothetical protein [Bacteroidota bacterium]